jgi:glutamate-ammonia-ligase adenylyltransferase
MSTFSFLDAIARLPAPLSAADAERGMGSLMARMRQMENKMLASQMDAILSHPRGKALLVCVFGHSPFLTRLILHETAFFADICTRGAEVCFSELAQTFAAEPLASPAALIKALRMVKGKASLVIAIADIAGLWSLEKVTEAMSHIAELCVRRTAAFLLAAAAARGEIALPYPEFPEKGSGLIVLAMGKLGARELNYSSDIDLIVLFDKETARYSGPQSIERFFPRLAQEMVRLLMERTADGYAFRVDLRLRPDPSSTPMAMSTAGAVTYYETVGQNWERAALIKARPIAGDMEAGFRFLRQIAPFIWRKHLDFAAIADIQSIKRQMDARTGAAIEIPGHNVKTGLGGIREIEFFAQIHQLIWGGREPALRIQATCATLRALADAGLIEAQLAEKLIGSYGFLRTVEHRLQMVDDQQTHSIPVSDEGRKRLAAFMNYPDLASFEDVLLRHLEFVHANFAESFRGQGALGVDEGNLSFTGVENDPHTLETIRKIGYKNPASVSTIIQAWHRGSRRATRTKRARELITELTPTLLKALTSASDPDQAFIRFDEFLTKLPSGVQLFSLFYANPQLLDLIAVIMGSAPALAEGLSKNPNLLDTVLTADFYHELPDRAALFDELAGLLLMARDFEDEMDIIRRFKNEKQFRAGIQLIRHQITFAGAGLYLSDIADTCIAALLHRVEVAFCARQKGRPGELATIAMGRLGARELTFGSDIDLIFVYDAADHELSNKLAQRFIGALTALTREGRLYEVDTRLRPSGHDGALAVSIGAFDKYLNESAWTFELMALTRARVITGNPALQDRLEKVITRNLVRPRHADKLAKDIMDLRVKITREFGSDNPWNLKYAHGGLMDMDFIAQYFVLLNASKHPELVGHSTAKIFTLLMELALIEPSEGQALMEAHRFLTGLFVLLRLCAVGILDETQAPQGLKTLIARGLNCPDFAAVKATLTRMLALVCSRFTALLAPSQNL